VPHRVTADGLIRVADIYEQVMGTTCPDPDLAIPASLARELAVEIVQRADAAENYQGPHGFVTRMDLLMRLRTLEERVARLLAEA
jgi:hypothetical protein